MDLTFPGQHTFLSGKTSVNKFHFPTPFLQGGVCPSLRTDSPFTSPGGDGTEMCFSAASALLS